MTNRVAIAAAECKATEDVTARTLAALDRWQAQQPVCAWRDRKRNARLDKRMRRDSEQAAVNAEWQARTKQVGSIAAIIGWFAVRQIVLMLVSWWWSSRNTAAMDDRASDV